MISSSLISEAPPQYFIKAKFRSSREYFLTSQQPTLCPEGWIARRLPLFEYSFVRIVITVIHVKFVKKLLMVGFHCRVLHENKSRRISQLSTQKMKQI